MASLYPSQGNFVLITKGIHPAVCCEYLDLGIVETRWGKKPKGAWVFQVQETDEDGRRKEVKCKFNLTLGSAKKPSKVQKMMGKWRGENYTQEELENGDVDPEKPVGQPCLLDIDHTTLDDGTVVHFVDNVLPPGEVRLKPEGYVPVAERDTSGWSRSGQDGGEDSSTAETEKKEEASGVRSVRPAF